MPGLSSPEALRGTATDPPLARAERIGSNAPLRVALVSPYDYPFPGGVTEHIGFLAAGLEARGHTVRILAPSSAREEELRPNHAGKVQR